LIAAEVKINPILELIHAIFVLKRVNYLSKYSIVSYSNAEKFVSDCLLDKDVEYIYSLIQGINMKKIVEYFIGNISEDEFIQSTNNSVQVKKLIEVFSDSSFINTISNSLNIFEKIIHDMVYLVKELHIVSRCFEAQNFDEEYKKIKLTIIPQLFMRSAPAGRYGFYQDDNETVRLSIIFGFNKLLKQNIIKFSEWYRLGVWHLASTSISRSKVTELLPTDFPSSEMTKHLNPNIQMHGNFQEYTLAHIVNASKLISEVQINQETTIESLVKEPYSKGLYHINWFINNMITCPLDNENLSSLINKWNQYIIMEKSLPSFLGPLEACFYSQWLQNIRLIFSPSISKNYRSILESICKKMFPLNVSFSVLGDFKMDNWDNYCNFVFAISEDNSWISELLDNINSRCFMGFTENSSFLFVKRNTKNPSLWTRFCVSSSEKDLLKINRIGKDSDWIVIKNGKSFNGDFNYINDEQISDSTKV